MAIFSTFFVYISAEKGLSPASNFLEKTFHNHNFWENAGGHGRWRNPIFPTWFFSIFFSFSRHYEALHRHARKYFSVTQLLPIIAHMQLASQNHDYSPTITCLTPHHPFPTTPITQSVEEFSAYTDRLRFSLFCFGLSRPLVETLGPIFAEVYQWISF